MQRRTEPAPEVAGNAAAVQPLPTGQVLLQLIPSAIGEFGPRRPRRESAPGINPGDGRAETHEPNAKPAPNLAQHAGRLSVGAIDEGTAFPFAGQSLNLVSDESVELVWTAEHRNALIVVARQVDVTTLARITSRYGLATASSASSRRSASSTSISPRSTASRTARRSALS